MRATGLQVIVLIFINRTRTHKTNPISQLEWSKIQTSLPFNFHFLFAVCFSLGSLPDGCLTHIQDLGVVNLLQIPTTSSL